MKRSIATLIILIAAAAAVAVLIPAGRRPLSAAERSIMGAWTSISRSDEGHRYEFSADRRFVDAYEGDSDADHGSWSVAPTEYGPSRLKLDYDNGNLIDMGFNLKQDDYYGTVLELGDEFGNGAWGSFAKKTR